jgi:hypothetical protein
MSGTPVTPPVTEESGTTTAEVPATGGWRLRTMVPDGIFTLALEADDETAAAEHAAFADRCLPVLVARADTPGEASPSTSADPGELRRSVIAELGALRRAMAGTGLGYLGALAGEHEGRAALIMLGIAAAPMEFPGTFDAASLLAAIARHQYQGAAVEEFPTAEGTGVGIRRCDELTLPVSQLPLPEAARAAVDGDELRIDTGISQALVPFPQAGLLASVVGYCFSVRDIDLATVFTATIAFRMTAVLEEPAQVGAVTGL